MRHRSAAFMMHALFLCLAVVADAPAADQPRVFRLESPPLAAGPSTRKTTGPRLALALAGGGARAAASLGVLKAFEREGIRVSAIAGTSGGALVGGLYAAGYSPDEIERIYLENDWNEIFRDTPPRAFLTQEQKEAGSRHLLEFTFVGGDLVPPAGLSAGHKLTVLLASRTLAASFEAGMDFDRLRVPFRAVATDIETGEAVPLGKGLLHDALRASSAVPLVFQPVEIGGRLLVDGGIANNLPVDVARSMGADIVIAVDPSAKLEKKETLSTLTSIFNQSISLQVRRETERQARLADLVIVPDTTEFSFGDFPAMAAIIRKGEEAAREALPRIRELMHAGSAPPSAGERFRITALDVRGCDAAAERQVRPFLSPLLAPAGTSERDIRAALADVLALGMFREAVLEVRRAGAEHHGLLTVSENPVVRRIAVSGNTLLSTEQVLDRLAWQVGNPLDTSRLSSDLDDMIAGLRKQGYLLARIERAGMEDGTGTLGIAFFEGRVDSIHYRGRTRTRRSLIQRETVTRPGAPLNFTAAEKDIQHLYALDYFESIDVDMAKSAPGGVDITLAIREKPSNRLRFGLRYDLEDAFTGLTDIIVDNITGRGIKAFLTTRYGNYTDIGLGYTSPIFLHSYFLHTVRAFYRDRTYFLYENKKKVNELDVSRAGIEVSFGYQWFRFGDTSLRYRFESDTTAEALGLAPARDKTRIGGWAILSTVDTRDSSLFPRRGALVRASYENASESAGSTSGFAKTVLFGQGALPLGERHTVLLEASAGFGSGAIPYHEQFGVGGADYLISTPLSGYERREFTGKNELGLSLTWQWKIEEYQLSLVKGVYLMVRGQAANAWNTRDEMSTGDLRGGAGIGLHADTIIGPVRLDLGFGEDSRSQVSFSAGFDF